MTHDHRQALAVEIAVEALLDLIRDLYDDSDCWYDHHGYCQGHGWMKTDPACPHARAKTMLAVNAEPEDVTHGQ